MNLSSSKWMDYLVLGLAFFLIVHSLDAPSGADTSGTTAGTGTLGKQIGFVLLFCYGFIALISRREQSFSFKSLSAASATAFFVLIALSFAWSIDRGASTTRLFGLFSYVVAASGAVKRLGCREIVRWYVYAQSSYMVVGLMNEVRLGAFHPFSGDYRFSGLAAPNTTGNDAVVLIFASIAMSRLIPSSRLYRYTLWLGIATLLLTKSRTAFLSTLSALLIVEGFKRLRGFKLGIYVYGLLLFVLTPFVLQTFNIVKLQGTVNLGRADASENEDALNGRTPLWSKLYSDYVQQSPILGYGYGAFWTPSRITEISEDQGWWVAQAHSTYLDAVLAVGVVGGMLYIIVLLSLLSTSIKMLIANKQESYLFGCLICAMLFDGLTDSEPWFLSSIYLFATIQAVFILNSLELLGTSDSVVALSDFPQRTESYSTYLHSQYSSSD